MILTALIGIPFLVGLPMLVVRAAWLRQTLLLSAAGLHLGLIGWLWVEAPFQEAWVGFLRLDAPGLLFLSLASGLFTVSSLYGLAYFAHERRAGALPRRVYDACLLFFLASMTLVATSNHVGLLWVAVEATTMASAPLVFYHRNHSALEATWKYLILCSVGIALALLGTFFLAIAASASEHATPSLFVDELSNPAQATKLSIPWLRGAFIFVLVGYGTKMGLAPLHTWLPDAHSEAPSPVSALLSGALLNCAFLGILRLYRICQGAGQGQFAGKLLLLLGVLSILMAGAFLVGQADYKRMLAYSSVEHMGVLALGVGLGAAAHPWVFLHAINHSLSKGLLFLLAGNLVIAYGSKRVDSVRGVMDRLPVTGWLFMLGFLAISGFPPFGLFLSEYNIVRAAFENGHGWVAAVLLLLLGVAFVGMATGVLSMVQGRAVSDPAASHLIRQPREPWLTVVMPAVLAAIVLGLGVYVPPQLDRVLHQAAADIDGAATPASDLRAEKTQ
jgi:hydrogenase-4 component F